MVIGRKSGADCRLRRRHDSTPLSCASPTYSSRFPAILIALLIDGVARAVLPRDAHGPVALFVLIFAIGMSNWVQYARTVRGSTLVEKNKEYIQAARVIGIRPLAIMRRHLLPNVMGPVMVLATINIATAIITEATLSFLGVGVPPTQPSLGTLDPGRQRLPVLGRMVDHNLPWVGAGDHGPGDQPARRLAARRAQSEVEVEVRSRMVGLNGGGLRQPAEARSKCPRKESCNA